MTTKDSVLEEAIANLREASHRIRATQNLMHSQGMTENVNYRELMTRLSTALAMTEVAYVEAKRRPRPLVIAPLDATEGPEPLLEPRLCP